jgi:hypothetical protein
VLGEVVADQDVEQLGITAHVGLPEGDELPVAGPVRVLRRSGEQPEVGGQQTRCDQQRGGCRVRGSGEHLCRGVGVVADQAMEQGVGFVGHTRTMKPGADGALTATQQRSAARLRRA